MSAHFSQKHRTSAMHSEYDSSLEFMLSYPPMVTSPASNASSPRLPRPQSPNITKPLQSISLSSSPNTTHVINREAKSLGLTPPGYFSSLEKSKFAFADSKSNEDLPNIIESNTKTEQYSDAESLPYLPASIIDDAIQPKDHHPPSQHEEHDDHDQVTFTSVLQPLRTKSYSAVLKKSLPEKEETPAVQPKEDVPIPQVEAFVPRREICPFFLQGSCRYGDFCRNSHTLDSFCPHCDRQIAAGEAGLNEVGHHVQKAC
jgi:hypothetical protein